ncbi:MAG: ATP-binding cassette domain-containing protein [Desulfococcaceae bacterium]|nr:ATP-binding cassette domain-containing protein [Desulfococcaceae bacterium]
MTYEDKSAMIRILHVHKRYGSKNALRDVTLDIFDKEFLFISGPSGAGKTTLLKLLYLGEKVTAGNIIVDGQNLSRIPRRELPFLRRKFGIIFQDFKLIPGKSVYENIALVAEAVGTRRKLIRKKVGSLLRNVGMEDRADSLPRSLSGGEQQRVAVARAIAGNPKIIVADEPTGSLDPESADVIMDLLRQYRNLGATIIIATHDTQRIRSTGGRVIILREGRVESACVIPKME